MPLLSLVQELLSQGKVDCLDKLALSENRHITNTDADSDTYSVVEERIVADCITTAIRAELIQLLSDEYYCEFIGNYRSIPSDIALEIERNIIPRVVNCLKHLYLSDFKKETLVRNCLRQILSEN